MNKEKSKKRLILNILALTFSIPVILLFLFFVVIPFFLLLLQSPPSTNMNEVRLQNSADEIYTTISSYLTDEREYPLLTQENFKDAFKKDCIESISQPCLSEYYQYEELFLTKEATYYYWTNSNRDVALVCVSLGGLRDEEKEGFYCTGTGFANEEEPGISITEKEMENKEGYSTPNGTTGWNVQMDWSDNVMFW
ncbi:MAG: hypothetical protein RBS01_03890 [Candidatus Dojkabacteria bacterium]|jgi:hypothetical protein|nr:hypothetical protein [Candidatus Dojkabacteria bacterium]